MNSDSRAEEMLDSIGYETIAAGSANAACAQRLAPGSAVSRPSPQHPHSLTRLARLRDRVVLVNIALTG